jgi:hypothetical protein
LSQTGNQVARCCCGQLYGGGENVKVLLALLPSALHLDFFAAAKPSRLGTARGEVTLLLSLDKRKF